MADLARFLVEGAADDSDAPVLVAPDTIEDAATVLTVAASHRVGVVPVGSGSTMAGIGGVIGLSTQNMAGVIDYQPDDLTVVVGAGTRLGDLEELLAERGHTAVLPEQAQGRTLGGVVASGASGYRRLKYGPTRDRVLEVTFATGYGEVVRAGGRLVKNVTGYDLARLVTGSYGSLGVVGAVCLKLWPEPVFRRTVIVDDAATALAHLYKPVAVLETNTGTIVYLEGDEATLSHQCDNLGGDATSGFTWPDYERSPVELSLRVPARDLADAVDSIEAIAPRWFVAQHGVGVLDCGLPDLDLELIGRLRSWAETRGGSLVATAPGLAPHERWGAPAPSIAIQRRMKNLFDPHGVCNPGVLPGGL